ncbi:glycosyl hydrolase family 18 protein [Streptomyces sp. NPDC048057]|uniref:glycosyl hydrolase family 18 protein n=1 Tax=Streptomyces sp. NPDC048057 TaxID=3155628 RepID=UPI0033FDFC6C
METRLLSGPRTRIVAALAGLATLLGLLAGLSGRAYAEEANHPGPPVFTAVTDTTVTFKWDPPPRPDEVLYYRIEQDFGTDIGITTGTTFTATHLNVETEYHFAVVAVSGPGSGWSSRHMPVRTTGTVPPMPAKPVAMGVFAEEDSYERGFHVKELHTGGSADRLTHLTYGYGTVSGGQCGIGDRYAALERTFTAEQSVSGRADTWDQPLRGHLNQLRELKARHPNLKLLWSFGGPERAGDWAGARQRPGAFATSCQRLIDDPRWAGLFDGIDLAMEYPPCQLAPCDLGGAGSVKALATQLRTVLGKDRTLTVTFGRRGGGDSVYGQSDFAGAAPLVDWYNVKTFDYYTPLDPHWAQKTAPAAPLDSSWNGLEYGRDANFELRNLTAKGVHPNKVVVGLPTHAWGWQGIRSPSGPPGQYHADGPVDGPSQRGLDDYRTVSARCAPTGEMGKTAYAVCGSQLWTYDTPATVTGKVAYMKRYGLGGGFLSNLRGDTSRGELLTALTNAFKP